MKTIEQVLKCLKPDCKGCERENYASCDVNSYVIELLEDLMQKQTPKKPIPGNYSGLEKCPRCKSFNVRMEEACCGGLHKFSYCPDCGQALDRSGECV